MKIPLTIGCIAKPTNYSLPGKVICLWEAFSTNPAVALLLLPNGMRRAALVADLELMRAAPRAGQVAA